MTNTLRGMRSDALMAALALSALAFTPDRTTPAQKPQRKRSEVQRVRTWNTPEIEAHNAAIDAKKAAKRDRLARQKATRRAK